MVIPAVWSLYLKSGIEGCGFKFSVAAAYTRATRPPSVKITVTNGSLEIYAFACVYSGDIPPLVKRNYVKKHVSRVDSPRQRCTRRMGNEEQKMKKGGGGACMNDACVIMWIWLGLIYSKCIV